MRYIVSEAFYNTASTLIAIAIDDSNSIEYEIAMGLIGDLITKEN